MNLAVTRRSPRRFRGALTAAALLLGAIWSGCGSSASHVGMPVGTVVTDFSLPDVNPASPTFSTLVAPSQHLGSASAWYFGHAT